MGEREVTSYAARVEAAIPGLARETGAPIVVLGHTYRPCGEMRQGVRYLNPGSWAVASDPAAHPRCAIRISREGERTEVQWLEIGS